MLHKKLFSIIVFSITKRPRWLLVPLFFVVIFILKLQSPINGFSTWWKTNFEEIAGAATLIVAVLLAMSELYNEWKDQLPKKLTVIFTYDGLTVIKCEEAWLAGDSDIRQWSQQIGRQMTEGENLEFEPFVKQKEEILANNNEVFKLYTAIFQLTKVPEKFKETYRKEYLSWRWHKKENKKDVQRIKQKTA